MFGDDDALTKALTQLGWVQAKSIQVVCASAEGRLSALPDAAARLVAQRPDVLVTQSSPGIRALLATKSPIPIVMSSPDPVGEGFVTSLASPGGRLTGVADLSLELASKRIQLLKDLDPDFRKIAVLYRAGGDATFLARLTGQLDEAARIQGVAWTVYYHQTEPENIDSVFQTVKNAGFNYLYVVATTFSIGHRKLIGEMGVKHGLRLLAEHPQFAIDGALLSYGVQNDSVQQAMSTQVDAVLRGAKPEDLPIMRVTKLHLVINGRTARELGVEVPLSLMARADDIVE
ncbi:ABC transporter substrate-binding protein [Alsobacter sp. SYSU BS001988]